MPETAPYIQLLRKMGHDMRVPLNTLISTSDMMVAGIYDPLTPKQAKASARMQRSGYRLLAILDDFVTYVRADAGDFTLTDTPFSPRLQLEVWCGAVRSASEEKGLTLKLTTTDNVPEMLEGDETLLKRIVTALLWNAVSSTSEGEIHITSEWTTDDHWLISIQDMGSGISEDELPHIFEPFWRGDDRPQVPTAGAGLGLPLSLALAQLMGGNLYLKASDPSGSTFCLLLPLKSAAVEKPAQTA
jgi:signal transduction histidine kinase